MKHTIRCSCGKLAIKCNEACKGINSLINRRIKEVFDDIKKHRCEDNMIRITPEDFERIEQKHKV